MSALPLFDLFLSLEYLGTSGSADVDRIARWSGQLVEEALAEVAHIRTMDEDLGAVAEHAGFNRQAAILLQGAYEDWSRRIEALLVRVDRVERRGSKVEGSERLRDELGRVSAMLQVTLGDLDKADEQARRGEAYTIEEVRRELRARNCA